jgi:hypothetical protein
VSNTRSEATSPRAIENVSGDSASRPWSSSSFIAMFETGTFFERTTAIFQSTPASNRCIAAIGSAASGSTRCAPAPVAAAAATAPLAATMSGL